MNQLPKPFFHSLTELPAGIGQHICDYPQHILWILNHICRLKNCGSQTDRLLVLTDYSIPISRIESVCSSTCKAGLFFQQLIPHSLSPAPHLHIVNLQPFSTQNCFISGALQSLKTAGVTRSSLSHRERKQKLCFKAHFSCGVNSKAVLGL